MYEGVFSLEAAAEMIRIMGAVKASEVLEASSVIRDRLRDDPAGTGTPLSEGLFYLDREPLRAFYVIDARTMTVEVTDFRVL